MQKRFGLTLFAGLAIIVAACGPGAATHLAVGGGAIGRSVDCRRRRRRPRRRRSSRRPRPSPAIPRSRSVS